MPKRKRSAHKKEAYIKTEGEDVKESIETPASSDVEEEIEDSEEEDEYAWKVVFRKQHKKGAMSKNELPVFGDIGKDLQYTIFLNEHKGAWEKMQSYKRWNMDNTDLEYKVGDTIAVLISEPEETSEARNLKKPKKESFAAAAIKHEAFPSADEPPQIELVDTLTPDVSLENCGIATVLECRAVDSEHVYLRIVWLYRPEDLVEGRQPWHADNELMPSNHMQIVEATTCNGKVGLRRWEPGMQVQGEGGGLEDGDEADTGLGLGLGRQFIWRQTLDTTGGKQKLSQVQKYCKCDKPADLSSKEHVALLECSSTICGKWQHVSCLVEAAKARTLATQKGKLLLADDTPQDRSTLSDPFQKAENGIKGTINSFTAGLVDMLTPASAIASPAAASQNGEGSQSTKTRGKGRPKKESRLSNGIKKEEDEPPSAADGVTTKIGLDVTHSKSGDVVRTPWVELTGPSGMSIKTILKCLYCSADMEGQEGLA